MVKKTVKAWKEGTNSECIEFTVKETIYTCHNRIAFRNVEYKKNKFYIAHFNSVLNRLEFSNAEFHTVLMVENIEYISMDL